METVVTGRNLHWKIEQITQQIHTGKRIGEIKSITKSLCEDFHKIKVKLLCMCDDC